MMTPTDFRAWRKRLGLTQAQAAAALDIAARTIRHYERGRRSGAAVAIPRVVALATRTLERESSELRGNGT